MFFTPLAEVTPYKTLLNSKKKGIHCRLRVGSGRRRRSVAQGWGPGTREWQHTSRDTIMERWGERTHSRTQAQLSLNCSALAAARVQLPTLASGVCKTNFTLDISAAAASEEAAASRPCHCCCPARCSPGLATAVPGAGMCVCA